MNFQEIISDFLDVSNESIGYYMIHLERAKERLPVIKKLETDLKIKLTNFEAIDGVELLKTGFPTSCAATAGSTRGPGDIGCTVSHYKLCCSALEKNYEYVVVFEDDCILNKTLEELEYFLTLSKMYLKSTNETFDMFLLGHGGCTNYDIKNHFLLRALSFNGTHAIILNKKMMNAYKNEFERLLNENLVHCCDGLYSLAIQKNDLHTYGVIHGDTFFEQNQKMYSYILEGYRS
jgi:GR25 family glycosyltransferase involved in LPS biosynthesis